ncbi:MAG: ATP-binding cassette domain-containing protein [Coriobacteriaceae bacterium]
MDVRVNPLISFVWVGFALLMVGCLIPLFAKRAERRRGGPAVGDVPAAELAEAEPKERGKASRDVAARRASSRRRWLWKWRSWKMPRATRRPMRTRRQWPRRPVIPQMLMPTPLTPARRRGSSPVETALTVDHLTKSFGGRKTVDDVSFALPEGAFLSVFGPNGAGKTTLLRMLATLSRPTEGTVTLAGIDVKEEPERVREAIGLISHYPMLYPDLTAEEILLLYAKLYGVADPERRVIELLDAVGLKHRRLDRVRTFSRGMTQRVSIARALVNDPSVVLLDEPYSGLDPHAMHIFDELIASVRENRTFVMVSHDLDKGLALATTCSCSPAVAWFISERRTR